MRAPPGRARVEATLGGDGRVNVEGDIGYCGPISHEDLMVALAHARGFAIAYLQSVGQRNHTSACFVLVPRRWAMHL